MDISETDRIKHRQIHFRDLHPERNDAETAAQFLKEVAGVLDAWPTSPIVLNLRYDIRQTCLEEIDSALYELGLHLDNGLLYRMKRTLAYYTEETLRENYGIKHADSQCTKRVFAKRFESIEHGCRDHRPEHWRRYL
ncbi:hypothetical protein [Thiorhodovibrio frisius]|uniref:Uncharacterized protein n=1 Tax=Thiorhodovibrio frisius TaxID=631362 RepID=H8Z2W6_9GAMM|nr:hypothetical protein [Thiorhodovibrio frisius]EIC21702.1 hypothetical protein Thi970DRAFT_01925 [Thiorhodovibrio frisius]WPL21670.1 hypothetical protein Thiofri_01798 [Thiorhodovibrio frisius]